MDLDILFFLRGSTFSNDNYAAVQLRGEWPLDGKWLCSQKVSLSRYQTSFPLHWRDLLCIQLSSRVEIELDISKFIKRSSITMGLCRSRALEERRIAVGRTPLKLLKTLRNWGRKQLSVHLRARVPVRANLDRGHVDEHMRQGAFEERSMNMS